MHVYSEEGFAVEEELTALWRGKCLHVYLIFIKLHMYVLCIFTYAIHKKV